MEVPMNLKEFKSNPALALEKAKGKSLEIVDDEGKVHVVISIPTPKQPLKVYSGYGAVVRINRDHPNYRGMMHIYIENLVYHGWDYEDDDIKIFTIQPELATPMEHVFVPMSKMIEPINQDHLRRLEKDLASAVKDGFVEIIHDLQPIVWSYYE